MIPADKMERMDFFMDLQRKEATLRKRMQLLYLVAAGIVLFPFVFVDGFFPGMGYFLAEKYMAIPCLLFFGSALCQPLTAAAKKTILVSCAAVAWFVLAQMQHHLSGMGTKSFGIFAVVYLLALPFAAVTEDHEKNVGLKWIGGIYMAFSLVLTAFCGMLLLDAVPSVLDPYVHWEGARATLFWHPNGGACILMLGIGFSLYFLTQAEKKWAQYLLTVLTGMQFVTICLTNSRTSIFLVCALVGGTVFFKIWKGTLKQFLAAAVAAVIVIAALVVTHTVLYDFHTQTQINKLLKAQAQQTEQIAETDSVRETETPADQGGSIQNIQINEQTGEMTLSGSSGTNQGDLGKDLGSLNGRTSIWKAAITAVRDNPATGKWGTAYVSAEISSRNHFQAVNAHNSWLETMMQLGMPGLGLALVLTVIAVWNLWILMWRSRESLSRKIVAMMVICILCASLLEAYIFVGEMPTSFVNFSFFLCTGYLIQWNSVRT